MSRINFHISLTSFIPQPRLVQLTCAKHETFNSFLFRFPWHLVQGYPLQCFLCHHRYRDRPQSSQLPQLQQRQVSNKAGMVHYIVILTKTFSYSCPFMSQSASLQTSYAVVLLFKILQWGFYCHVTQSIESWNSVAQYIKPPPPIKT